MFILHDNPKIAAQMHNDAGSSPGTKKKKLQKNYKNIFLFKNKFLYL